MQEDKNEKTIAAVIVSEGKKIHLQSTQTLMAAAVNRQMSARQRRQLARKAAELKWGQ